MGALTTTGQLVRLDLPALPAFVGVARSVVAAVATALERIDEDRLEDLRVAVSEACTNAVEANRGSATGERVVVHCSASETGLEVCIEDTGKGFDVDTVDAAPGPDAAPNALDRGWGIQLIQALVDEVSFRQTDGGTAVDLVIRFDRSDG